MVTGLLLSVFLIATWQVILLNILRSTMLGYIGMIAILIIAIQLIIGGFVI